MTPTIHQPAGPFRRMLTIIWPPLVSLALACILLEDVIRLLQINAYILPAPSAIFTAFWANHHTLVQSVFRTGITASLGFCIAAVSGILIGIVLAATGFLRRGFYPLANLLQMVPLVAIAPLLTIWFGYGLGATVAAAAIVSIFPVIANTVAGLAAVDPKLRQLFHIYGASRLKTLWHLELPAALPTIFIGLRIAAGLAVIGTVVGEFVSGYTDANPPIGVNILIFTREAKTALVFASIGLSACIGFALFGLVSLLGHLSYGHWHPSTKWLWQTNTQLAPQRKRSRYLWLGTLTATAILTLYSFYQQPNPMQTTAPASHSDRLHKVRLQLNWIPEPEFGGFFAAEHAGYFNHENLDVQIIKGVAGTPTPQLIASGKVEFGIVNADQVVIMRAAGLPIVPIYASFQTYPRAIMVHQNSPYPSLKSLWQSHSQVAVGTGMPFVRWLNAEYGGQNLQLIPNNGGLGRFIRDPAWAQSVFIFAEPITMQQKNIATKSFDIANSGYNPYSVVLATNEHFIQQHPTVVQAMVRAVRRGWQHYLKDPDPTNTKLHQLNPSMSFKTMSLAAQALTPYVRGDAKVLGTMTHQRWSQLNHQLYQIKAIDHMPLIPDPLELFTPENHLLEQEVQ